MIIDIHGHYTTAPPARGEWRDRQIAQRTKDALAARDAASASPSTASAGRTKSESSSRIIKTVVMGEPSQPINAW